VVFHICPDLFCIHAKIGDKGERRKAKGERKNKEERRKIKDEEGWAGEISNPGVQPGGKRNPRSERSVTPGFSPGINGILGRRDQ
jgi:hypothetical protein